MQKTKGMDYARVSLSRRFALLSTFTRSAVNASRMEAVKRAASCALKRSLSRCSSSSKYFKNESALSNRFRTRSNRR